jgi:Fe-S oxidoreductase/nitrate reductase gamma subunit
VGWNSPSSPAFDFRFNGSALPMYAAFLVCLAVLLVGIAKMGRRVGPLDARDATTRAGRLGRLLRFVFLQRRISSAGHSGWIHLPIFWGFVILGLGSLTIMFDSYVLQPLNLGLSRGLGYKLFQASLDLFGIVFVLGVGLAIHRRVWTRPERKPADAVMLVILIVLLGIGISGFILEGLRIRLENVSEPWAFGGSVVEALISLAPLSLDHGMLAYRVLWWGHVVVAFGLIAAIPFTALRHMLTAPVNILGSSERLSAALTTPFNLKELMQAGSFDVKVGTDSIEDFTGRERLGFAACADAGRCQEACPAHAAGTQLSPSRLVRALRTALVQGELTDDAISEEAIWSCTLCGACTATCPVLVDPIGSIAQLRRGLVTKNRLGKQRTDLLANLTRAGNPYGSNGATRGSLGSALGLQDPDEHRDADVLYWIGCAATFDTRARKVAEAMVRILNAAGIRYSILGSEETCCGDPARRIGEEGLFQDLAFKNIDILERHGVKKVLTHCAHCFNTLRNEYPDLGARFEVVHHATFISELIRAGSILPSHGSFDSLTLHDACYVGRFNGGLEPPRSVLRSIPDARFEEMPRSGTQAFCCGAGGGNYWYEVRGREKIGTLRMREAEATKTGVLVTECPFCLKMLEGARAAAGAEAMQVRDIAEIVADSLDEGRTP